MIKGVQHRSLRRLYEDDDRHGINTEHVEKVRRILAQLKSSLRPEDMDIPGFKLHPLEGDFTGFWSVTVRANWRIIAPQNKVTTIPGRHSRILLAGIQKNGLDTRLSGYDGWVLDAHLC
jgi:toxin HigB-1